MRNWLLIQLICWSVQGAIPQRDWVVREMGPGTFRNTSKMMDFFFLLWRETLRLCLETCCYDVLFLFRWFEGFNWDGLCERTLTAPVIPKVRWIQYWLLVFTAFHVRVIFFYFCLFQVKHSLGSGSFGLYAEDSVEPCTDWDDFWGISMNRKQNPVRHNFRFSVHE